MDVCFSKGDIVVKNLAVFFSRSALFLLAVASAACSARTSAPAGSQSLTPAAAAAVADGARAFMQAVAHDVTQEGPLAWLNFFDSGPGFFMAVNGQLAFPTAAAAEEGTRNFARTIEHIELAWGGDLRVDPLTPDLAVVAASWREVHVDKAGHRTDESGYFTGLAELRDGRWRFRDAHWSAPVSPPPAH
jgi:hypothetical protein